MYTNNPLNNIESNIFYKMNNVSVNEKEADRIADVILKHNPNIRETNAYKQEKNIMIDETMSCDIDEAVNWMAYWMKSAAPEGNGPYSLNFKAKYLAAYDLYKHLTAF